MREDESAVVDAVVGAGEAIRRAGSTAPGVGSRLEHAELGYRIQGAAFEVYRGLGAGFLESVYEQAMLVELQLRGLRVARQVPIAVHYKHRRVGRYFADLVVEGVAVVELKAQFELSREAVPQILNYLRASRLPLAFLINFAYPRATVRRFVATASASGPDMREVT